MFVGLLRRRTARAATAQLPVGSAASAPSAFAAQRWCSDNGVGDASADEAAVTKAVLDEVDMLVDEPLQIGTLFKALSPESRKFLNSRKLPIEPFLLKHKTRFTLFRDPTNDCVIMVSRFGCAPTVRFTTKGKVVDGTTDMALVYQVLRYIPNEWAPYTALPIPGDVKSKLAKAKSAKKWFDAHPKYFEVYIDPTRAHTFDVRRSLGLQQFMAQQQRGDQPPPSQ